MWPCDEQEQDRLDLLHKVITEARIGDGLLYAPHPSNARVLDLGCGTGIRIGCSLHWDSTRDRYSYST
ncbi:hypothetical protein TSTA_017310 [Talaromyces stipitatus ATCC 10500]|uniref:Uncharacterized protein n=1 Tax=Talaromyces stipitatus (strain ATCC 10500 / CBS 375.48 / QM 6759 / NRRL 1006) TaxID=441959 RepID=B8MFC2_TALSN|nr:uncharacterized protein TSTA_017310 [Talaromyces stipitatus ATCC 10500]EED16656.1 hypothetical protein TSTA_017310 [Talaromyces stipitatus ATCC 10500]